VGYLLAESSQGWQVTETGQSGIHVEYSLMKA